MIVAVGLLSAAASIYVPAQFGETRNRRASTERSSKNTELNGELVVYPNPQVGFICGPQLKANSRLNPFPWFDSTEIRYGHVLGKEMPSVAPRVLTGLVSASPNSSILIGKGTRFLSEVDPSGSAPFYNGWLRILDGAAYRELRVISVQSNTQLTLSSPWSFAPIRSAKADTYHQDAARGWNYDRYYDSSYYDLALTEYIAFYRTEDPAFLSYGRKMADALWRSPYIDFGTITQGSNHLPPRSQAFAGLMLRALDGKPEYWDYLYREVRATFDNWVKQRRNNAGLYYDIREDGYAQLYAVLLARVLPNQYPLFANGTSLIQTGVATDGASKRAALLADAEDAAVNFFGRLQQADGSWRFNVDSEQVVNIEQPFMTGLYLESVVLLHQLTSSVGLKTRLHDQITRACRHLYRDTYRGTEVVKDMPQYRWRGMFYYWGGGTKSNPTAYVHGRGEMATEGNSGMIQQVRHLNSTVHHAFGYAYAITGDEQYLKMGDEVFDASYGERVDGLHCLANDGRGKDYAMNFRASGRYLVWRLGTSAQSSIF
jgi:hypothetical protein